MDDDKPYRYMMAPQGSKIDGPIEATDPIPMSAFHALGIDVAFPGDRHVLSVDRAEPGHDTAIFARYHRDGTCTVVDAAQGQDAVLRLLHMRRTTRPLVLCQEALDEARLPDGLTRAIAELAGDLRRDLEGPPLPPDMRAPLIPFNHDAIERHDRMRALNTYGALHVSPSRYRGLLHDFICCDDPMREPVPLPEPQQLQQSMGYGADPKERTDHRNNRHHRRATASWRRGRGKKP